MKFSALIPFIPDYGRRDYIWNRLRTRYETIMPELELCIGSHNLNGYHRSKAINAAFTKATGDILIIVDADVFFHQELLQKIVTVANEHPWIIPFRKGIRLTREASDRFISEKFPESFNITPSDILHEVRTPGAFINVINRFWFEAVLGFDERFQDYGGEDEAFSYSLATICGPHYRMDGAIYHLWHEPMELTPDYHRVNFPLYLRYQEAAGDHAKMQQLIHERNFNSSTL